jgi:hypothetical protein
VCSLLGAFVGTVPEARSRTTSQPAECRWSAEDSAWFGPALDAWSTAAARLLDRRDEGVPRTVLYDASCTWTVGTDSPAGVDSTPKDIGLSFRGVPLLPRARAHGGTFEAPDGERRRPAPMAAALIARDGRPFVLLGLLSVWQEQRPDIASDPERARWLTGVALHEMVHTLHLHHIAAFVERLQARPGALAVNIGDDVVEETFRGGHAYRHAFFAERDLLYRAALARTDPEARGLATEALTLAATRRAKYFSDQNAAFADLERVFLTMEGMAEWFAFRAVP